MKFYTFKRVDNDFSDILKETSLLHNICIKLLWKQHLMLGLREDIEESVLGYLVLKYGDEMIDPVVDFTPVPGKDYVIKRTK